MITIKKRTSKILSILFCLLPNIASSYFIFILLVNKLFPTKYLYPTIIVIVLLNVLIDWLISNKKGKKASRIFGSILLVVVLLFSTVGAYAVNKGLATLDGISKNNESIIKVSVIVLKDSPIETAAQIKGLAEDSIAMAKDKINKIMKAE